MDSHGMCSHVYCDARVSTCSIQNMISRTHARIVADANREQFTIIDMQRYV